MSNGTIKKLSLNKETIRSLTPDQLEDVNGGTSTFTVVLTPSILSAATVGVAISWVAAKSSLPK